MSKNLHVRVVVCFVNHVPSHPGFRLTITLRGGLRPVQDHSAIAVIAQTRVDCVGTALGGMAPFAVEGLEEHFLVYEGSVRTMIPLRFTKNLGPTVVTLRLEYQACTPTVCFPPGALRMDVPLNGLDLIRD